MVLNIRFNDKLSTKKTNASRVTLYTDILASMIY